jgi:uncharacterized protein YqgC (DUF456 family)
MEPWLNISIFGITMLVMLIGLVGLVIPLFPGIVVIWLGALGYGILAGFNTVGIVFFVLITLLMLVGVTIDNVLMGVGARRGGASWVSIGLGLVAGIIGTLLVPPIGGLIAAPLAVFLVEYLRVGDWAKVIAAVRGLATGWGLSFLARFGIGLLMFVLWGFWVWLR